MEGRRLSSGYAPCLRATDVTTQVRKEEAAGLQHSEVPLCPCVHNEDLECFYQDGEIDEEGTRIEIAHIKLHALLIRDVLAPTDLPEAGDARPHRQTLLGVMPVAG